MKKIVLVCLIALASVSASADVYVNGYFKQNGTYVAPHTRTHPDGNPYNNKSYNKAYNYRYGE